jgi:hypothetical protein
MAFPTLLQLMAVQKLSHKKVGEIIKGTQQLATKKINEETEFKRSEMINLRDYFRKEIPMPELTMDQLFSEEITLPKNFYPSDSNMNQAS